MRNNCAAGLPDLSPQFKLQIAEYFFDKFVHFLRLERLVQLDRFAIRDLAALSARLPEYALVIIGTQANYAAQKDFGEFHREWDEYVRGGGIILMLDANYEENTRRVLGYLVDGNLLARWECGNAEEAGRITSKSNALFCHPFHGGTADFPFAIRSGAHFTQLPEGYQQAFHSFIETRSF